MMSHPLNVLAWVITVPQLATASHIDDDPIKSWLAKAKMVYEAEMADFRKDVGDFFDKRENAARKDGDKKRVDQIKEDRQQFIVMASFRRVFPRLSRRRHLTREGYWRPPTSKR